MKTLSSRVNRVQGKLLARLQALFLSLSLVIGFLGVGISAHAETAAPTIASMTKLPQDVTLFEYLDQTPAPDGAHSMFYVFQPPEAARFGVITKDRTIAWQKIAGFRPLVDYFWSKDSTKILYVTDCIQPEADLRSPNDKTRSWFFVLDAATGKTLAEGDLDTDILDLPKQMPEAVGASHLLEVVFENDLIKATIDHLGKKVSGSKSLQDLTSKQK